MTELNKFQKIIRWFAKGAGLLVFPASEIPPLLEEAQSQQEVIEANQFTKPAVANNATGLGLGILLVLERIRGYNPASSAQTKDT